MNQTTQWVGLRTNVTGPIFISHSSADRDDANALAAALRAAFSDRIRTFNTSSGAAIQAGDRWRPVILDAIKESSVVVLWCTPAAAASKEVAFEIGAAFAFGRKIIPCAVHLSPSMLPWSLSEFQAPALDTPEGWLQLAEAIANTLEFGSGIDEKPLRELSKKFTAPSDALAVSVLGRTLEFKNTSNAPIANIHALVSAEDRPQWIPAIEGGSLQAGQAKIILRQPDPTPRDIEFTWTDVAGATHRRRLTIGAMPS